MLGTVFRLCILVKNCHLDFKKAPVDSTSVASLKSYSYGDITKLVCKFAYYVRHIILHNILS